VLAHFRGLQQADPPTTTYPGDSRRWSSGNTLADMEQQVLAKCPRQPAPAISAAKRDRAERDAEIEAIVQSCVLFGSGHMDSSVDLIRSRPTLGAIRESSKRKAIAKDRAIRERAMLPAEQRNPAPLESSHVAAFPTATCRWCSAFRQIVRDGLCQPCLSNPTAIRVREEHERQTGKPAEAFVSTPVARPAAPQAPVATVAPKPAASVRMVRQVGPDGKTRFVRAA
jgi:hypothetical protein